MINFVVRRTLLGMSSLLFISVISFVIIQLPEGDYIDSWYGNLTEGGASQGINITLEELNKLRALYGLDRPLYVQYLKWVVNLVKFDFGITLEYSLPVSVLLRDKLLLTAVLAGFTVIFTWLLAIPIGIYSAVRQHSLGDYTFTFVGFIGLAVPDFLLALVLMYFSFQYFGMNIGGLFSSEFLEAPWSVARVIDLMEHLWIPAFVLGTSGTAALIGIMPANVLDELHRPMSSWPARRECPSGGWS